MMPRETPSFYLSQSRQTPQPELTIAQNEVSSSSETFSTTDTLIDTPKPGTSLEHTVTIQDPRSGRVHTKWIIHNPGQNEESEVHFLGVFALLRALSRLLTNPSWLMIRNGDVAQKTLNSYDSNSVLVLPRLFLAFARVGEFQGTE